MVRAQIGEGHCTKADAAIRRRGRWRRPEIESVPLSSGYCHVDVAGRRCRESSQMPEMVMPATSVEAVSTQPRPGNKGAWSNTARSPTVMGACPRPPTTGDVSFMEAKCIDS